MFLYYSVLYWSVVTCSSLRLLLMYYHLVLYNTFGKTMFQFKLKET